jgi:hypothetical protein
MIHSPHYSFAFLVHDKGDADEIDDPIPQTSIHISTHPLKENGNREIFVCAFIIQIKAIANKFCHSTSRKEAVDFILNPNKQVLKRCLERRIISCEKFIRTREFIQNICWTIMNWNVLDESGVLINHLFDRFDKRAKYYLCSINTAVDRSGEFVHGITLSFDK